MGWLLVQFLSEVILKLFYFVKLEKAFLYFDHNLQTPNRIRISTGAVLSGHYFNHEIKYTWVDGMYKLISVFLNNMSSKKKDCNEGSNTDELLV